jgi:hypothetical protein
MPSTLKVTSLLDSGPGSLRYEIAQAQNNDTIVFDFGSKKTNSTPHTITLTSGELDINKKLTIQGPGAGLLTVDSTGVATSGALSNGSSRIFEVESFVTNAILSGMTISNGVGLKSAYESYVYSPNSDYYDELGGGVLNLGKLTISACTVSNNFADYNDGHGTGGAGVANFGTLTVSNSTLSNNQTFGYGGGIYNHGTLNLSGCTLSGNSAYTGGGIANFGTLAASGSTLSGNTSSGHGGTNNGYAIGWGGGAIYNEWFGKLTVSNCTLSNNSALYGGEGGGIYNNGAASALTVLNSMFSSNTPDNIFGLFTDGGGSTFN